MSDVTIEDVENLSSKGWTQLIDEKKQALLDRAEREANGIYSKRVSTLPTIVGQKDDFIMLLAAHHWELAQGGEAQSESSSGGSVNYNNPQGDTELSLTQTRYGREAYRYLRDNQGIGVIRMDR